MKQIQRVFAILALACSTLIAAEPALPDIPTVLVPLKAKILKGRYSGLYLGFRAEQPLTEEQWTAISELGPKGVGIGGKSVDDEFMARFAKLDLEVLSLDGSEGLSDEAIKYIATMKSLRFLSMGHMLQKKFTGASLSLLKDLPALETLTLAGSGTGKEAMEAIGQLTQLKELANWHTRHSDPLNSYLLKLTNLKSLSFGQSGAFVDGKQHSSLTDATMDTFAQMKSLESLTLMQARLTLPALKKLKALPNLKKLDLNSSIDLPAEDIDKLRAEMPGVTIQWKPLTDVDRTKLHLALKDN